MTPTYITMSNLGNNGRLGNQLFQLAFLIGAGALNNKIPCVPPEYCQNHAWPQKSPRLLKHLNILPAANRYPPLELKYIEPSVGYVPPILQEQFHYDADGYFQTYRYFTNAHDQIVDAMQPPCFHPVRECALHIRRTDYLGLSHLYHVLSSDTDYYRQALNRVRCASVDVYTDDPTWVAEHRAQLFGDAQITLINGDDPITLMYHMAAHKQIIIANSSYSWWAAWIGEHVLKCTEIVVGPTQWFKSTHPIRPHDLAFLHPEQHVYNGIVGVDRRWILI
jgi:hypothetical protein